MALGIVVLVAIVVGVVVWHAAQTRVPEPESTASPTPTPDPTATPSPSLTPSPSPEEPYIKIISPNGGEEWMCEFEKEYKIEWQSEKLNRVIVWLRDYSQGIDFKACRLIEDYIDATDGEFIWTIGYNDCNFSSGDKFKIAITEPEGMSQPRLMDESGAYFTIFFPVMVIPDYDTVLLSDETLTFNTSEQIGIIADDSVEFYRGIMEGKEFVKEKVFTIEEFYNFLRSWDGPPWPIYVVGKKTGDTINAKIIYYILQ